MACPAGRPGRLERGSLVRVFAAGRSQLNRECILLQSLCLDGVPDASVGIWTTPTGGMISTEVLINLHVLLVGLAGSSTGSEGFHGFSMFTGSTHSRSRA